MNAHAGGDAGARIADVDVEYNALDREKQAAAQSRKEVMQTIAGVAGNVLEWYDFAVFGYFSDIIGEIFFPEQEGNAALIESFAVFGGAFLVRPAGGLIMGYIGDTFGRKRALETSIFLMAVPTFAMGCLPTYDQAGWLAVFLLVVIRLLQGLSVGGQLMSSLVFTVEKQPWSRWGLYGSFVMAAANFGTLLGGLVGFAMRAKLSHEELVSWGWRVPFLAGVVVSFSGIYLKYFVEEETPHVANVKSTKDLQPVNPIRMALSPQYRRALLSCCMVPALWSGGFYLSFVWMAIFMADLVEAPIEQAFAVNSLALLFSVCLFFSYAGELSDKFGRKRIMFIGGIGMSVLGPMMVYFIGLGNALYAFASQIVLGILLSLWGAPMMAWMVESFPPEARLTAVSIGYNASHAVVGGMTPSVATLLVSYFGVNSPGLLLSAVAVISLAGLCISPKSYEQELSEDMAATTSSTKAVTTPYVLNPID